ncbi:MAG: Secreted protein [Pseudonocardia sp.]|jgi:uncharacterized protein DUF1996|nr:Secreted protein [Pseudonocardia sp.]
MRLPGRILLVRTDHPVRTEPRTPAEAGTWSASRHDAAAAFLAVAFAMQSAVAVDPYVAGPNCMIRRAGAPGRCLCDNTTVHGIRARRSLSGWIVGVVVVCLTLVSAGCARSENAARPGHSGAAPVDYVDISQVAVAPPAPAVQPDGSTGTWRINCGRNEQGIHNSDNVVASPGVAGGAHHFHDYVGNVSTNAFSTDQSLAAAGTTCPDDDRSTYYWPVLREPGPGGAAQDDNSADGNMGPILVPASVLLEFRGSPVSSVVEMPRFLRATTGNPHGFSTGGVNTEHVQWTCSGARDRVTKEYPRCAPGQQVVRIFDMPSCWNGTTTDSADHRSHLVFPDSSGACQSGTFPVPQLHMEIAYTVTPKSDYTIDSFPEEQHSPISDHGDFIDVMPDSLMDTVVSCINSGQHCGS